MDNITDHTTSSHDPNPMLQSMIMMSLVSTITPLIANLVAKVAEASAAFLPTLYESARKKFGRTTYAVTIRSTKNMSRKNGFWVTAPEEKHNVLLISSLLEFMSVHGVYSEEMRCNLGAGDDKITDANEFMKSRVFEFIPTKDVTYDGFTLSYAQSISEESDKSATSKCEIDVTVKSAKPTEKIEEFLRSCYNDYADRHHSPPDKTKPIRYLYKQFAAKDGVRFKKYVINNRTTFNDIYLPDKVKILEMVEKFQNKELNKLALLLHGQPGCGKTSIIKALASHLGYSVIEVKLSLMKNDSMLNDLFHNQTILHYQFNDEGYPLVCDLVPLDKRIYIFEDIDAECEELHDRSADPVYEADEQQKKSKSEDLLKELLTKKPDRSITLAGVLNALDGVLEISGILVMTTNHLEKLDEALVRPGRITYRVELRKMLATEANKMICNKFGKGLDNLHDYTFTPATLQSLCQAANNIDELRDLIHHT